MKFYSLSIDFYEDMNMSEPVLTRVVPFKEWIEAYNYVNDIFDVYEENNSEGFYECGWTPDPVYDVGFITIAEEEDEHPSMFRFEIQETELDIIDLSNEDRE